MPTDGILSGKTAVVTGAGRGLGAAIAAGLAQAGAAVIVTDIDGEAAIGTATALRDAGHAACAEALDITDRTAVAAFAATLGALDVLVNNAGVAGRAAFQDTEATEVWDRVMAVNLEGTFNMSRACVPALAAAGGNVVHLGSVAGFVAGGSSTGYVVSKGGVHALTRAMARDLAPLGIRVNAVAPGVVMSDMALAQLARPGGTDWFMNRVMMKRIGEAAEVVAPVVFLASSLASYITGVVLPVDGGFLAA